MEKIINYNKKEISHERAWRIIHDITHMTPLNDHMTIVRIACHKDKKLLGQYVAHFFDVCADIKKIKRSFPLNLLPSPYYFHIFIRDFQYLFDLAKLCDNFLMFEIAVVDEISFNEIKEYILNSDKTLYENMIDLSYKCQTFFMCGFDFDDPEYESGVSQVAHFNFVPNYLSLYFHVLHLV